LMISGGQMKIMYKRLCVNSIIVWSSMLRLPDEYLSVE
jgi:hypothetical protein